MIEKDKWYSFTHDINVDIESVNYKKLEAAIINAVLAAREKEIEQQRKNEKQKPSIQMKICAYTCCGLGVIALVAAVLSFFWLQLAFEAVCLTMIGGLCWLMGVICWEIGRKPNMEFAIAGISLVLAFVSVIFAVVQSSDTTLQELSIMVEQILEYLNSAG